MVVPFLVHGKIRINYLVRPLFRVMKTLDRRQLAGRVPGSPSAAFQNSLTSCRMGNDNGCLQTGLMLFQGIGVKQDVAAGLNGSFSMKLICC